MWILGSCMILFKAMEDQKISEVRVKFGVPDWYTVVVSMFIFSYYLNNKCPIWSGYYFILLLSKLNKE